MKAVAVFCFAASLAVAAALPPPGGVGGFMPQGGFGGFMPPGGFGGFMPQGGFGGSKPPAAGAFVPSPAMIQAFVPTPEQINALNALHTTPPREPPPPRCRPWNSCGATDLASRRRQPAEEVPGRRRCLHPRPPLGQCDALLLGSDDGIWVVSEDILILHFLGKVTECC
ncbi:hypothetical protein C7M84_000223 [Penaeus vannamei]|uniref:Uncharacterized protein n=1 Tax=Penaeus vannamei TaxID=6689 RepID=A0A3R7MFD1_PENVA|nr:hypothetical protein C7M84_000223 [Penaeus vannamei]